MINRAGDVIHVAIDESRTDSELLRVRVHRLVGFEERVQWIVGPPRVRMEDALLSRCAEATSRVDALAVLTDACRRRITTPARLADELHRRTTVARRGWLLQALDEAADGVQSMLESGYRRRVERAHGLPRPDRQRTERTEDGVVHRDVTYERFRLVIELDGRIGHELSHDRWDDQDRDLLVAGSEVMTLRLGWRHCESTPCRTAGRLARVLRTRDGRARRAGAARRAACRPESHVGSRAPGDWKSTDPAGWAQCGCQASSSLVRAATPRGSRPSASAWMVTFSQTSRRLLRAAIQTCWRASADRL